VPRAAICGRTPLTARTIATTPLEPSRSFPASSPARATDGGRVSTSTHPGDRRRP
jgi:hypothetical protein